MCTYLTSTEKVAGTGLGAGGWFSIEQAVVYFDHPQEEMCIRDSPGDGRDPTPLARGGCST